MHSLFCHVSDVSVLCRQLEAAPSASTAGRIQLDQREVVQHHFGELHAQATRNGGISFATDTTIINHAERASKHYEMRIGGKVRHIRAPVVELAPHTAEEQFTHNVSHIMEDTRRVVKTVGLVGDEVWKRVSLAYLNRVMGDHVNEAL